MYNSTLRHASATISGHHQAVLIQFLSTFSAMLIGSLVKRAWHVLLVGVEGDGLQMQRAIANTRMLSQQWRTAAKG
jgi:hypothetical protein